MFAIKSRKRGTMAGAFGVLAISASVLAACGSSSSNASTTVPSKPVSTTTFTLGLTQPSAEYAPVYIAQQEGFFTKNHLKVNFDSFSGGGSTVAAALASNSIQVVLGGIDLLQPDALGDIHIKFFQQLSESQYAIYASHNIASPAALVGKKIGTGSLSDVEYIWWHILFKSLNIDPSSVSFVLLAYPAHLAALEAGSVNAVINDLSSAPPGMSAYLLVKPSKLPQIPLAMFAANDSFITAHPQAMQGFTDAINEAVAWMKTNQAAASKICQAGADLKPSQCVMDKYWRHTGNLVSPYDFSTTGAIDSASFASTLPAVAVVDPAVGKLTVSDVMTTQFTGTKP